MPLRQQQIQGHYELRSNRHDSTKAAEILLAAHGDRDADRGLTNMGSILAIKIGFRLVA